MVGPSCRYNFGDWRRQLAMTTFGTTVKHITCSIWIPYFWITTYWWILLQQLSSIWASSRLNNVFWCVLNSGVTDMLLIARSCTSIRKKFFWGVIHNHRFLTLWVSNTGLNFSCRVTVGPCRVPNLTLVITRVSRLLLRTLRLRESSISSVLSRAGVW